MRRRLLSVESIDEIVASLVSPVSPMSLQPPVSLGEPAITEVAATGVSPDAAVVPGIGDGVQQGSRRSLGGGKGLTDIGGVLECGAAPPLLLCDDYHRLGLGHVVLDAGIMVPGSELAATAIQQYYGKTSSGSSSSKNGSGSGDGKGSSSNSGRGLRAAASNGESKGDGGSSSSNSSGDGTRASLGGFVANTDIAAQYPGGGSSPSWGLEGRVMQAKADPAIAGATWQDVLKGGGYWQDNDVGKGRVECCLDKGGQEGVEPLGGMGSSKAVGGSRRDGEPGGCVLWDVLGSNFTSLYVRDWL